MYILSEWVTFLIVAILLGALSFAAVAAVVLVQEGFEVATRFARQKRNRVQALTEERETESAVA